MVKVRTLVPLTDPESGEPIATGSEVDVSVEVATDWRADGKVSLLTAEAEAAAAASEGVYDARTSREEAPAPKEGKKK